MPHSLLCSVMHVVTQLLTLKRLARRGASRLLPLFYTREQLPHSFRRSFILSYFCNLPRYLVTPFFCGRCHSCCCPPLSTPCDIFGIVLFSTVNVQSEAVRTRRDSSCAVLCSSGRQKVATPSQPRCCGWIFVIYHSKTTSQRRRVLSFTGLSL